MERKELDVECVEKETKIMERNCKVNRNEEQRAE